MRVTGPGVLQPGQRPELLKVSAFQGVSITPERSDLPAIRVFSVYIRDECQIYAVLRLSFALVDMEPINLHGFLP